MNKPLILLRLNWILAKKKEEFIASVPLWYPVASNFDIFLMLLPKRDEWSNYNHIFWAKIHLHCGNWHFKSKRQWHLKTSVQKLWKGANCFVMHQISLCSIAHKRHLRSRRRMVHIMLPFSGGKGLGVVLCPFCILLPYSECPERMLSVSIFTQLCGELGFAVDVRM